MVPDIKFLNYCQLFELEFLKFHGQKGINREERILDKLTEILASKFSQDFNKKVLAFFVKVRTFIRMKTMILEVRRRNATGRRIDGTTREGAISFISTRNPFGPLCLFARRAEEKFEREREDVV